MDKDIIRGFHNLMSDIVYAGRAVVGALFTFERSVCKGDFDGSWRARFHNWGLDGRVSLTRMVSWVAAADTDMLGGRAGNPRSTRHLLFSENFVRAILAVAATCVCL